MLSSCTLYPIMLLSTYVSIPSPMCTHQAHNVCMPSLRHYARMHHPCTPSSLYPISGVHTRIYPITHVHPPIHSIIRARTSLNHYACTHPCMYLSIPSCMCACMPALVQTIRGVFPSIPFGLYTPPSITSHMHAPIHQITHARTHAIIHAVLI